MASISEPPSRIFRQKGQELTYPRGNFAGNIMTKTEINIGTNIDIIDICFTWRFPNIIGHRYLLP